MTVNDFTAIINDPQAAIMAVGGGNKSFVAPPPGAFPEDDASDNNPSDNNEVATALGVSGVSGVSSRGALDPARTKSSADSRSLCAAVFTRVVPPELRIGDPSWNAPCRSAASLASSAATL